MTREVEIIGGPYDGRVMEIPDANSEYIFPVELPPSTIQYNEATMNIELNTLTCPLRRTDKGWRIYWNEGT
jgi:hypothetical protein